MVGQESGTIAGWRAIGLHADHSGLNKFQSKDDANFRLVAAKLRDRVGRAPAVIRIKLDKIGVPFREERNALRWS